MNKHHASVALVLASLFACAAPSRDASTAATSASTPARDRRLVALDAMRAAIEAKDARAVAALYAEDAVVEPAGGKTLRGRAAIEASARAEMAPAESIRVGIARVWLKDDVAIVETIFRAKHPAASGLHDIGGSEISTKWFDREGRITHERTYAEQANLEAQAKGESDADPIPAIPTTTEVHVAGDASDDAARIAWVNTVEANNSRSDEAMLATLDDPFSWDCALGFHSSSRAELSKALTRWRTRFPDEKFVATHVWPVDDYLVVEELVTGTHEGDLGSFKASHKPTSWHWLEIWKVKNGKIARGWSWANFDELASQIRLEPSPERKAKLACTVDP